MIVLPAREFLLSGGRITYEEYVSLNAEQRQALADAGALLMREMADVIVEALTVRVEELVDAARLEDMAQAAAKGVPA